MEVNDSLTGRRVQSWEGRCLQPSNHEELVKAISLAFDYRGDVTIQLTTGKEINGYVFDLHEEVIPPFIRLFLPDSSQPHKILYEEITGIVFSGPDTAFGRSWEDWAKKWKKIE